MTAFAGGGGGSCAEAGEPGEAASRRRHPTALWLPDVERMRRRLEERSDAPPVVAAGTSSVSAHERNRP